jgi:hypothetical protein
MITHDLVKDGAVVGGPRNFEETPALAPNKNDGAVWLPRFFANPDFAPGADQVRELVVTIEADRVVYTYSGVDRPLADLKAAKNVARRALYDTKVAAGYPKDGLHVEINDGSRANLAGLAVAGMGALGGLVEWGANYQRGWVTLEGARIALPTAQDGIALTAEAGAYYSALVQRSQDLEDAILAAEDIPALNAIDLTTGW